MDPSPPTSESPTPLSVPSSSDLPPQTSLQSHQGSANVCRGQSALKAEWNNTIPVNSLPNELSVEIFLIASPNPVGNCGDTKATLPSSVSWPPLMLVCRHWRNVILCTPRLWRVINARRGLKWMELAISRSQNALLDISFRNDTPVIATYPILLPIAKRIAALAFNHVHSHQLPAVLRLINSAQSSLIELRLTRADIYLDKSWRNAVPGGPYHSISFERQRAAMVALTIHGVPVSLKDPQAFFSRLRILDVRKCILRCDPPISTLSTFLDILASCVSLEKVCLCGVLSQFHEDQPQHPGRSTQQPRIASIPKLRELTIEDEVEVVSSFMSSLHVPRLNVNVRLIGEVDSPSADSPELFIPLPPLNRRQTLPILDTVRALTVHTDDDAQFHLCAHSDRGRLNIGLFRDQGPPLSMLRVVDETTQMFANAPLTELSVVARMVDDFQEAEWVRLFAGFRLLESFALSSMGMDALRVFDALAESQPEEDGGRVVCPRLRRLCVDGPLWHDDTLDCIVECLATRASGGATALEELVLTLSFESYEEFEDTKRAFLHEIRAVFAGETDFGCDYIAETDMASKSSSMSDLNALP